MRKAFVVSLLAVAIGLVWVIPATGTHGGNCPSNWEFILHLDSGGPGFDFGTNDNDCAGELDADTVSNWNMNAGHDAVWAGGGSQDVIKGEQGNDVLRGEGGTDFLHGGTGSDTLHGNLNNDWLYAGSDSNVDGVGGDNLQGSDGNDTLMGGGGNDILDGGNGHDHLVHCHDGTGDTISQIETHSHIGNCVDPF